jgi:hypothetical protein
VRLPVATAAAAILGVNVQLPDGSVPTLAELAAEFQQQVIQTSGNFPSTPIIWSLVQNVPPSVTYPPRFIEQDDLEDPLVIPVAGPRGPAGVSTVIHLTAEDPDDALIVPGPAGAAGAAGSPGPQGGAGPAIWFEQDSPEDPPPPVPGPPGIQGPPGSNGVSGGIGPAVYWTLEEAEDPPQPIPGPVGPAGAAGAAGAQGALGVPLIFEMDEPQDAVVIPGPTGAAGAAGAAGAQGGFGVPLIFEVDEPQDSIVIPGPVGPTGATGTVGVPIIFEVQDPDDPLIVPGPTGATGPQGAQGVPGSSSAGGSGWAAYLDFDYEEEMPVRDGALVCDLNVWSAQQIFQGGSTPVELLNTISGVTLNLAVQNNSTTAGDDARIYIGAGSEQVALFCANQNNTTAIITEGPTGPQATLRTLGAIPLVFGTSNTYAGQITATGDWIIALPASGDALTVNLLDDTNVSLVGPTTPTDGFGIQWFNGSTSPGWIGTGIWAIAGSTISDIGIASNGGAVYIGTGGSGTARVKVANAGNVTINAPTSGVAATIDGLAGLDVLTLGSTSAAGNLRFGWNTALLANGWNLVSASSDPLGIGTVGAAALNFYTDSALIMSISSVGAVVVNDTAAAGATPPFTIKVPTSSGLAGGMSIMGDGAVQNTSDFQIWQDTVANSSNVHVNNVASAGSIFLQIAGTTYFTVASSGLTAAAVSGHTSLTVNGGLARAVTATKTANYSALNTDTYLIFNGTASITLTLLAAGTYPGRELLVKTLAAFTVVSASSNVRPISSATAGTAILPATAGAWALLVSDGTDWVVMANGT